MYGNLAQYTGRFSQLSASTHLLWNDTYFKVCSWVCDFFRHANHVWTEYVAILVKAPCLNVLN